MRVTWTGPALDDIEVIQEYIARYNPKAAQELANKLIKGGNSLEISPTRGRIGLLPGTREFVAVRPDILVYEIRTDEVRILRVWHAAQDRPRA